MYKGTGCKWEKETEEVEKVKSGVVLLEKPGQKRKRIKRKQQRKIMLVNWQIAVRQRTKDFIQQYLSQFDTSKIEKIVFKSGRGKYSTGECLYPISNKRAKREKINPRKNFTIICRIPEKMIFPYKERIFIGCKQLKNGAFKWIWDECVYDNIDDATIWIFGHEIWHFLRRTRQVPGRNTQSQANKNGFKILTEYKNKTDFI